MASSQKTNAYRAAFASLVAPLLIYMIHEIIFDDANASVQQTLAWIMVAIMAVGIIAGASVIFTFIGHRTVTPVLFAIIGGGLCAFMLASIIMPILRNHI
jgi:hypothetical protein